MARNWTRAQQKRYKAQQQRKLLAARVADKLLGIKRCTICGKKEVKPPETWCDDCLPF